MTFSPLHTLQCRTWGIRGRANVSVLGDDRLVFSSAASEDAGFKVLIWRRRGHDSGLKCYLADFERVSHAAVVLYNSTIQWKD